MSAWFLDSELSTCFMFTFTYTYTQYTYRYTDTHVHTAQMGHTNTHTDNVRHARIYICTHSWMHIRTQSHIYMHRHTPTHAYTHIYMWPNLPKGILYTHSFRSYFSQQFDRYNNRSTVHACTIAKASTVCFYWGLLHGPDWCPRMCEWLQLADSWQGFTTVLAGETEHICSYICDVWNWKQPELKPFGHKIFCIRSSHHFVAPHHPPPL